MGKALAGKPSADNHEDPPVAHAALAVNACAEVLRLRVGTAIGAAMTREVLSRVGPSPEALGRRELRSFAARLVDSASVFLDDDEIEDLRQSLDHAIRKHLGDPEGAAWLKTSG